MSEELAEHLSRFTPDKSGLDRDALLFAAGRASRRRHLAWPSLAALLATSQVLTLALLWPRTPDAGIQQMVESPQAVFTEPVAPTLATQIASPYSVGQLRLHMATLELPPTIPDEQMIEPRPPLYAFTTTIPEWLR